MQEEMVTGDLPWPPPLRYGSESRSLTLCDWYQGYDGYEKGMAVSWVLRSIRTVSPRLHCFCDKYPRSPALLANHRSVQDSLKGEQPTIIPADVAYNVKEIRQYNREWGIKSNIPVNRRYGEPLDQEGQKQFDLEVYLKYSVIERSISGIETFKRSFHGMSGTSTHSWDWFSWHASPRTQEYWGWLHVS